MSNQEGYSVSGRLAAMTVIIGALLADAKRSHDHPRHALLSLLDDADEQIRRALEDEPAIMDLHCREVFIDAANVTIVEVGLIAQGFLGDVGRHDARAAVSK